MCQACFRAAGGWLCPECQGELRRAPDRLVGKIPVVGAFTHDGVARDLILRVKYQAVTGYLDLAAELLAPMIPGGVLVPIPRSGSRLIQYGIDPPGVLARRIAARTGLKVVRALSAPVASRRRARGSHRMPPPRMGLVINPLKPVVLVDDVVTTGATMAAAARQVGVERVSLGVAANIASRATSSA